MTERSYTCPRCGRTSHHPKDLEHGYCSACGRFEEDDERLQRLLDVGPGLYGA